jgi:protein-arginine kinase activator protein McsA
MFKDGVIYINLKDCHNIETFFKQIYQEIKLAASKKYKRNSSYISALDMDKLIYKIIHCIQKYKILLIFDDCDKILSEDYESFKESITNIIEKVQGLKIIVTSKIAISNCETLESLIYKVNKLDKKRTLQLIKQKSPPNSNTKSEIRELVDASKSKHIINHYLLDIIDGHPLSVIILSSLRTEMSLLEIYDLLKLIQKNNNSK